CGGFLVVCGDDRVVQSNSHSRVPFCCDESRICSCRRDASIPFYDPLYACSNVLMSSFFICSNAFITLSDFSAFLSCIISAKTTGTICQETPYLSFSQPHCCAFSSPPCESLSQ